MPKGFRLLVLSWEVECVVKRDVLLKQALNIVEKGKDHDAEEQ